MDSTILAAIIGAVAVIVAAVLQRQNSPRATESSPAESNKTGSGNLVESDPTEQDQSKIEPFIASFRDGNEAQIEVSFVWKVVASRQFLMSLGSHAKARRYLLPCFQAALSEVFGSITLAELRAARAEAEGKIIATVLPTIEDKGIAVTRVLIKGIREHPRQA